MTCPECDRTGSSANGGYCPAHYRTHRLPLLVAEIAREQHARHGTPIPAPPPDPRRSRDPHYHPGKCASGCRCLPATHARERAEAIAAAREQRRAAEAEERARRTAARRARPTPDLTAPRGTRAFTEGMRRYLAGPEWETLRRRALAAAGDACQACGTGDGLTVHHRTYERAGAEVPDDLVVLCWPCHRRVHNAEPALGLGPATDAVLALAAR